MRVSKVALEKLGGQEVLDRLEIQVNLVAMETKGKVAFKDRRVHLDPQALKVQLVKGVYQVCQVLLDRQAPGEYGEHP